MPCDLDKVHHSLSFRVLGSQVKPVPGIWWDVLLEGPVLISGFEASSKYLQDMVSGTNLYTALTSGCLLSVQLCSAPDSHHPLYIFIHSWVPSFLLSFPQSVYSPLNSQKDPDNTQVSPSPSSLTEIKSSR